MTARLTLLRLSCSFTQAEEMPVELNREKRVVDAAKCRRPVTSLTPWQDRKSRQKSSGDRSAKKPSISLVTTQCSASNRVWTSKSPIWGSSSTARSASMSCTGARSCAGARRRLADDYLVHALDVELQQLGTQLPGQLGKLFPVRVARVDHHLELGSRHRGSFPS